MHTKYIELKVNCESDSEVGFGGGGVLGDGGILP